MDSPRLDRGRGGLLSRGISINARFDIMRIPWQQYSIQKLIPIYFLSGQRMTLGCRGGREGGGDGGKAASYFYLGISCVHGKPCALLRLLVNDCHLDVSLVTILIQSWSDWAILKSLPGHSVGKHVRPKSEWNGTILDRIELLRPLNYGI